MVVTMNNSKRIIIPEDIFNKIKKDCKIYYPEEACGVLAGLINQDVFITRKYFQMTNIYHSQTSYRFDPEEQIRVFEKIDELGFKLLAITHSHPSGPSFPSITDIRESYYPDIIYLIWYPSKADWHCKSYIINKGYQEVDIVIDTTNK